MNAVSPDIVVMSPEGEYLIVVEVKVNDQKDQNVRNQHAIRQIKQTMAYTGCSTGLLVAGENVILLRDSLEKSAGESIYIAGEAKIPESLLLPINSQGKKRFEFELRVQQCLEQLKLTFYTENLPHDFKKIFSETIISLLRLGEVRIAHPRWSQAVK